MVAKRQRVGVVLDTNVLVRALKKRAAASPNYRLLRLWLVEKRLQLVVCPELIDEYLRVFHDYLQLNDDHVAEWRQRFYDKRRVTCVNLANRVRVSRDPDDDLLVSTTIAGHVDFLVSNDRDLLDIPQETQTRLRCCILTPGAFLQWFDEHFG